MELGLGDVGTDDLLGEDVDALLMGVLVQSAMECKSGLSGGVGNQLDVDLMGQQFGAPPVLGNEREEAILDVVPFAGVRQPMYDGYRQACLIN